MYNHVPVLREMLHNLVIFIPEILNLNQDYSLTKQKMTTNVALWQSTINKLSNDIQHNGKLCDEDISD